MQSGYGGQILSVTHKKVSRAEIGWWHVPGAGDRHVCSYTLRANSSRLFFRIERTEDLVAIPGREKHLPGISREMATHTNTDNTYSYNKETETIAAARPST